jgi:hypothetical protein
VSFAAITLYVASQRVIPKESVYFVIDSVRKLLDTTSHALLESEPLNKVAVCKHHSMKTYGGMEVKCHGLFLT